jgi:hypothetical protein
MLDSHSKPTPLFSDAFGRAPVAKAAVPSPLGGGPSDAALDAALCRVRLPDGLLSRLNAMLETLADEIAAPID